MASKEAETRSAGWYLAFRFVSRKEARIAYELVRDAVLTEEAEASVFRFMVGEESFVAVVAEEALLQEKAAQAEQLMSQHGVQTGLASEILDHLLERRRNFKSTGLGFFERRGAH